MPTFQSGRNVLVAYKPETVFNVPPVATGGFRFRPNAGGGLKLARADIAPNEIRADGMTAMGRKGSRSVTGGYPADLAVGAFDPLLEAALRGTWTAAVAVTNATAGLTSITTQANSITATAGSWLTAGVRVGDVVRLTGHSTVANNGRNLRVTGVTALILSIAETLVVDAVADATFTLTIARTLVQPAVMVRRSFTFEEYDADIDLTEQSSGVRVSSVKITGAPDGMAIVEFGLVGADLTPLATGQSPFFTAPTLTSSVALTVADATIRYGGSDVTALTAFEMTYDVRASTQPVIGSLVTPAVFDNNAVVTGSISGIRSDFTNMTRALAETELELHVLLVEPESEPKDFISLFLPRLKLAVPEKSFGGDGAMIETMAYMAGPKDATVGYDQTMLKLSTSAA